MNGRIISENKICVWKYLSFASRVHELHFTGVDGGGVPIIQ